MADDAALAIVIVVRRRRRRGTQQRFGLAEIPHEEPRRAEHDGRPVELQSRLACFDDRAHGLAGLERLRVPSHQRQAVAGEDRNPGLQAGVAQRARVRFGRAQAIERALKVAEEGEGARAAQN